MHDTIKHQKTEIANGILHNEEKVNIQWNNRRV